MQTTRQSAGWPSINFARWPSTTDEGRVLIAMQEPFPYLASPATADF